MNWPICFCLCIRRIYHDTKVRTWSPGPFLLLGQNQHTLVIQPKKMVEKLQIFMNALVFWPCEVLPIPLESTLEMDFLNKIWKEHLACSINDSLFLWWWWSTWISIGMGLNYDSIWKPRNVVLKEAVSSYFAVCVKIFKTVTNNSQKQVFWKPKGHMKGGRNDPLRLFFHF